MQALGLLMLDPRMRQALWAIRTVDLDQPEAKINTQEI